MRLLLSSAAAGGLNAEKAFSLAKELQISGLEVLPFKKTLFTHEGSPEYIRELSREYGVSVNGIHLPFFWHTKPLLRIIGDEYTFGEKALTLAWKYFIGSGHGRSPAMQLIEAFPEAYVLCHPDVFMQMPGEDKRKLRERKIYFENERSKRNTRNDIDHIRTRIFPEADRNGLESYLMFDPRHAQIDMELGKAEPTKLEDVWRQYRPRGMHFSFIGEGYQNSLPDQDTWKRLREAIAEFPPEIIVLEVGPKKENDLRIAREMVSMDLGI